MQRNSFIQMSKLTNVKGRITYISSRAKQENLYAVYETGERKFWRELANIKGLFKGKLRKQLQGQIEKLEKAITSLNHQLPEIVQKYGYKTVQDKSNCLINVVLKAVYWLPC